MAALADQIEQDITVALKGGDADTLSTLRLLKNSLMAAAKAKGEELSDEEVVKIIQKEAKQRQDSITSYKQGNREDLAAKEETELGLLERYLPAQLSDDELVSLIDTAISESGAKTPADMGQVMKVLSPQIAGKADGGRVAQAVRAKLQG